MIYSFGGWVIEMFVMGFTEKKMVNRGFLLGPYCPIYGVGGLLMTFLLHKFTSHLAFLFFMAILIGSVLEYITGYLMEKIFKAKWWDYSNKFCNLNGRICLLNSILFGLLGVILIYIINPFLHFCLFSIPIKFLYFIAGLLLSLFIIDCIVSFHVITELKLTTLALKKDYSDEMSHKVREVLSNQSWSFKRILNAFPDLKFLNIKDIKEKIKKQAKKIKDQTKKLKKQTKKLSKIKRKYDKSSKNGK